MNAPAQTLMSTALQIAGGLYTLDPANDKHAWPALIAYAASCKDDAPDTARDLIGLASAAIDAANEYVPVAETILPGGHVVPAFWVAKYMCSKGPMDIIQVNETGTPWVDITHDDARAACAAAGRPLLTLLQSLAIAWRIVTRANNWTGGAIGAGKVYQGLHKGTVSEAQPGTFVSDDPEERRWHEIDEDVVVVDFVGNVYCHLDDDVHGDERGLCAGPIPADSPILTTPPHPSMEKGMGWRPKAGANASGRALVRGGYWDDRDSAGVFYLSYMHPSCAIDLVGFRGTKPA